MTVALAVTSNSIAQQARISPPDSAPTGRPEDAAAAPTPAIDPDWHSEAKGLGLQPQGITRLSKQKFLITSRQFNQAFHTYANPQAIPNGGNFNDGNAQVSLPHFITSDAVLNAFHVLFEESITQLERLNASRMRAGLADLWKKLPAAGNAMVGQPARVAAARFRAQVLIGTALRLAGGETPDAPTGVEQAIQANLSFARAAEASLQMPAGGGTPDAMPAGYRGIDFTRLRPRGFYADGGRLAGYFQAVAWLQQVQFRLDHDDEVLAAHLIGSSLIEPTDQNRRDPATFLRQVSTSFDSLLGPAAEPQLVTSALVAGSNRRGLVDLIFVPLDGRLDADKVLLLRSTFQESLDEWLTDRVWVSGERQRPPNAARSFRVLCARTVPEAALLNATSAPPRYFPSGLDLLVALGSKRAETLGRGKDWPNVVDTAREADDDLLKPPPQHAHGPAEKRENVYREYLRALAALVQPVDTDAPPFMKSTAWQTKQCQTALAGWAQMRHTWLLQAEDSTSLFAGTPKRAGFVEPVPRFWSRLEHVVRLSHELLKEQGALGEDVGNALLLEELEYRIAVLVRADLPRTGKAGWDAIPQPLRGRLENLSHYYPIMTIEDLPGGKYPEVTDGAFYAAGAPRLLAYLRRQAELIRLGLPPHEWMAGLVCSRVNKLDANWRTLAAMCRRLESLAHRQLRKQDLDEEDTQFIEGFGKQLAAISFHYGVEAVIPKDDAPRVADVHTVVGLADRPILEVGIGRPRELLVLYPWKGEEVLCRGAVMPYYEFRSKERLTDAQWRAMLDSDRKPPLPNWTAELYRDGEIREGNGGK